MAQQFRKPPGSLFVEIFSERQVEPGPGRA
jgi:hypothetical protein